MRKIYPTFVELRQSFSEVLARCIGLIQPHILGVPRSRKKVHQKTVFKNEM